MKPVIPDYDWSIFGVRIIQVGFLVSRGVENAGATKNNFKE